MFLVEYYQKNNGEIPCEDFILSLNEKMQAKVFHTLELLELYGNELREPYSKHIGDGIFELRVKQGSNITRVLYFFFIGKKAILTNGFVKKTQKTPQSEIDLSKKYRDDYISRNNE